MNYYLGVDGGGTYTRFVLFDDKGCVIDRIITDSIHYMKVGYEGITKTLRDVDLAFKEKGFDVNQGAIVFGLGGYGADATIRSNIENAVFLVFPNAILMSDAQFAMTSALSNQDGVYVISGTGSIAMRKSGCQQDRRGGFGYLLGDEGSAFWIGHKLLALFTQEADGRLEKTALYSTIMEHFELNVAYDLVLLANKNKDDYRNFVAKISGVVAFLEGIPHVDAVYEAAGIELARLANAFDINGRTNISYGGGVLTKNEKVRNAFVAHLDERYNVIEPDHGVEYAAYILCHS